MSTKYKFGQKSNRCLSSADPAWTRILTPVLEHMDIAVICGHRGEAEQMEAFTSGKSQKMWPESKHNALPSLAVDVIPWPVDWGDTERFCVMAGCILQSAATLGYTVRWGGDWDQDYQMIDEKWRDYGHFELVLINA